MGDDDGIRFRPVEGGPPRVACAHCGREIVAASTRCEHCGVHFFDGTAADYANPPQTREDRSHLEPALKRKQAAAGDHPVRRRAEWVVLIAIAAMVAMVLVLAAVSVWRAMAG